jgi:hypothetical protein
VLLRIFVGFFSSGGILIRAGFAMDGVIGVKLGRSRESRKKEMRSS